MRTQAERIDRNLTIATVNVMIATCIASIAAIIRIVKVFT